MALKKDCIQQMKYVYEFAKDGGAIGAIALRPWVAGVQLDEGMIVTGFSLYVEAAITSAGSHTVTLGTGADADGFLVDFAALATANAVLAPGVVDGALVWNTTTDSQIHYRVGAAANTKSLALTVATAALTAGKLVLTLDVMLPSAA